MASVKRWTPAAQVLGQRKHMGGARTAGACWTANLNPNRESEIQREMLSQGSEKRRRYRPSRLAFYLCTWCGCAHSMHTVCTRMYTDTYPPHTHIGMPVPCPHPAIPSGSPQGALFASKGESIHSFLFICVVLILPRGLGEMRG